MRAERVEKHSHYASTRRSTDGGSVDTLGPKHRHDVWFEKPIAEGD